MEKLILISIIIPAHNEEKNIPLVCGRIFETWKKLELKYNCEIIFVNDGSADKSAAVLEKLSQENNRIKYLEFSRNFGKELAISAGIFYAKGEAMLIIDADLQHPPELIPQFVEKWEKGAEIVIGIRHKNKGEGLIKKFGSKLFYKIMNSIGETKILPQETDYRLLDKKVAAEFNRFTERNRIARGLIDWLGFKKDYIYFDAGERINGQAQYDNSKLFRLALASFVSQSLFPLKFAGYLGVFITFFAGLLGLFIFVERYILNDPWSINFSGPAILAVIILFLIGIVLSCLGLIALYIASIHAEVINRPMFVIRKKGNLEE